MSETVDAVVVGAGPNGLSAAIVLADQGWDVLVLEANDEPGGAVRTGEVTAPGFRNDLYSAFYPLAPVSPALKGLHLEDHGLRWFEEPVRWTNADVGMRDVRLKAGVPVAAGQSETARADVRRLLEVGAIDVGNFDALFVVDDRTQRLSAYSTDRKSGMAPRFTVDLPAVFRAARAQWVGR